MDDSFLQLAEYFKSFPGIGERQARRFVYFLLSKDPRYIDTLATLIKQLRQNIHQCQTCYRYFSSREVKKNCDICESSNRDLTTLMVVEKDSDLESIERSKSFSGKYFVLGGLVPVVEKTTPRYVRIGELKKRVEHCVREGSLTEIILAFAMNPNGDHTDTYVRGELRHIIESTGVKLTSLGKGLSTGSELEYADRETLKNALKNRM